MPPRLTRRLPLMTMNKRMRTMKFQPASVKELKRVSLGTVICLAAMLGVSFLLSLVGLCAIDYRVLLGGLGGTVVAIGNFAVLCLTIQAAAEETDPKRMKARFQLSYNARLIAQAAWVVAAFLLPWFNAVAAALPLVFPSAVIFFLQARGKLVTPSNRKKPAPEEAAGEEDLSSFEV